MRNGGQLMSKSILAARIFVLFTVLLVGVPALVVGVIFFFLNEGKGRGYALLVAAVGFAIIMVAVRAFEKKLKQDGLSPYYRPGAYGDDAGSMLRYTEHEPLSASERREMEELEGE
ncbi:MAG: hypothetical protein A2842_02815 [Candidatus Wildermuthbacteria bacterium RIFCSPHIGHO2_01_FULL_48_25]|uniref:Uncharacterized protein n=1 Tax=Candidatus Wildermuthbacteria bacterium RIFCSPLOWO2_01_FULL_48_16 TaxID=1802461 RepID=A0A1G2RJL8_9BACT|nr:MAG: hypothetical protein A2842_02815 [Candidatus Wildermuthbacteria bacterium RIFCSPHIGHO2_01_FULL_48_25]OHA68186.1 MAG: hypothetical protein A3J57_02180 [Candidatus Wildermuthbacteria bacterium RIFCSPHIGHO2_02_FULL_49_12b]OHA73033.1 MAG: hypothetical protein A3B24_01300 [Candidatus Wildermuthbacteria bacterium RIFCSPLOWO2_01_FULL_48_16]